MDWFLYDDGLRHERVKLNVHKTFKLNRVSSGRCRLLF